MSTRPTSTTATTTERRGGVALLLGWAALLLLAGCSGAAPVTAEAPGEVAPVTDAAVAIDASAAHRALTLHRDRLLDGRGVVDVTLDDRGAGLVVQLCAAQAGGLLDLTGVDVPVAQQVSAASQTARGAWCGCGDGDTYFDHGALIPRDGACKSCECVAGAIRCPQIVACDPEIVERVRFAAGSARLPDDAAALLDAVAEVLAAHPELDLALVGHAAAGEKRAVKLSQRRARAVRDALIRRGVAASRLVRVEGQGATRPLGGAPADDRRVDFEPVPEVAP